MLLSACFFVTGQGLLRFLSNKTYLEGSTASTNLLCWSVVRDAGPSFIDAGFERRHIGEVP